MSRRRFRRHSNSLRPSPIPRTSRVLARESHVNSASSDLLGLQLFEEGLQTGDSLRLRPVADARSVDFALEQARVLEHLEVLRDGRLRKRQMVDDVTANTAPAPA